MKKRKILYISGTRADYGLMEEVLFAIKKHPKLEIELIVAGMHLMPEFGKTIDEIKKDDFKIHKIETIYKEDNKESMVNFIGEFILKLIKKIKYIKPDIILVLGDRAEMLAAAIVGAYLTIPVAHIHGGELSLTVDGIVRHAITKLSNIHLCATKKSSERIIKMGELKKRVFIVGAPGLDSIHKLKSLPEKDLAKKYDLNLSKPILIVIQHPVTIEIKESASQMEKTMEAVKSFGYQAIVVYPNADAGGREMIKVIEKYRKYPFIKIFKSIPYNDYLSLMKTAKAIIGNSSSGIIEAASLHKPVINIGSRQKNRERGKNVININHDTKEIKKAIKTAIFSTKFKKKLKRCHNPYWNGGASAKIVKILDHLKINKNLLAKQLNYL